MDISFFFLSVTSFSNSRKAVRFGGEEESIWGKLCPGKNLNSVGLASTTSFGMLDIRYKMLEKYKVSKVTAHVYVH